VGGNDGAFGVALQSDGKIVAVGTTDITGASPGDFAIARYNPNGSLDRSFSGDGKQTTDLGGVVSGDGAKGVAIQANGKIVAVGEFRNADAVAQDSNGGIVATASMTGAACGDFALARYNTDGSLDTSFSGDGKQTTDFGSVDGAQGMALQADGQIVAVGATG